MSINKSQNRIKNILMAIIPGLIVTGLILAANIYYDLDLEKVVIQEITKIIGQLESTATTTLATLSGNVGIGTTAPQEKLTLSPGSNFAIEMATPGAPTLTCNTSGGTLPDGTYYYKIVASDGVGYTVAGPAASCTISGGNGQGSVTISWSAVPGASSYRVYGRDTNYGQYWTTSSTSFVDTGTAGTAGTPPTVTTAYVNKITASGDSWILCGNVGIGTTTPAYKLTVNGDLYVSATSTLGSATSTPVIFNGYIQSNFVPYSDLTYNLGSPNFRWANLYIGTTTISNSLNLSYLTEGSVLFAGPSGEISQNNSKFFWDNTNLRLGIGTSNPAGILHVATGTINALVVSDSGNVGIGTSTPKYKLEVVGMGSFDYLRYKKDIWTSMAPAPASVSLGGSLVYTGGDYIYAFRGGGSTDFWRYSISTNSWTSMAPAPAAVSSGGSLVYTGGDYIYAFRGGGSTAFWRYSISTNSWTSMAPAPASVYDGASLVYTGGDYIYAFRGNGSTDFWRYSISTNSWTSMARAPASVSYGGSLVYTGGDYIYAFGGINSTAFWRYSISTNSWTSMAPAPASVSLGGSLVYTGGDYIYAFKGGGSTDFWRYSISTNSWTSMAPAPASVSSGASLVYTGGDYIYAFRGNGSTDFWRYTVGIDTGFTKLANAGLMLRGNVMAETNFGIMGGNVGIGTTAPQQRLTLSSGSNFAIEMATPGAPTLTCNTSGGTLPDGTYYYKIVASDGVGYTVAGPAASCTISGGNGQGSVTISWSAVPGASSYRVYGRDTNYGQYWTTSSTSFVDTGTAGTAGTPPTVTTAYVNKITASGNSWILGGNIGIGTTAPSVKLHVYESALDKSGVLINIATTSASYYVLNAQSAGTSRLYIRADGNVGIGTTAPAQKLHVEGNTYISGNLGIGTTTAAYKLTVNGDLYVSATSTLGSATSTPVIFGGYVQSHIIPFSDTTYNLGTPEYRWANFYVSTTTISNSLNLSYLTEGSVLFVGQNGLISQNNSNFFWDNTNLRLGIGTSTPAGILHVATGTIDALVIDSSGNVGIGTTDVTAKLKVENLNQSQASLLLKQQSGLFVKTIGGSSGDYGYSIQQTSDGGYVITGGTYNYGTDDYDVFVIKLDSSGSFSWAKTIGGEDYDSGSFIQQTSDGGYVIVGDTFSYGTNGDVFVIKLDSSGSLSWAKTIGGTSGDSGRFIQQTSDGGYVIVGYTASYGAGSYDVFLIKLDSSGSLSWAKTIGGTSVDIGYSIQQTSDGGYVIVGDTFSYGTNGDVFVIKLDSSGSLSWAKTIGGTSGDSGRFIQQTSDGGYVITGETYSYGAGDYDVFVIKLDSSGSLSWAKTIGGTSGDSGHFIQQTSDGGYVIVGYTTSYGAGSYDVFLIKLDFSGSFSWAKTIGGEDYDSGSFIQQTSDGGYVMVGETWSYGAGDDDVFVIKLDSSGNCDTCSLISSASPTVSSTTPTVNTVSPSVSSISPSTSSPSPTVSSQSPSLNTQCSGTTIFTPLFVNSTGQIGIGTESPLAQLDVAGKIRATGICLGSNCYNSLPENYWNRLGNDIFYNAGNVGIGTTAPGAKLEVRGDIASWDNTVITADSPGESRLGFVKKAGTGPVIATGASWPMMFGKWSTNNILGNVGSGSFTEFMRIDTSGNVGIGTTAPTAKLHIAASLNTVPFQVGFPLPLPSDWAYRRQISISNTTSTLTDYQVLVTLDTASLISQGKMRSDCGDIKFTDSDGTTTLSYWLESGCNTTSTKIWVKVPEIPASSTKKIYVYYGNSNATSTSSGEDTFLFFDDFSSGNLNKWQQWGNGTYSISYDPTEGGRAKLAVYRCSNAHLTTSFTVNTNNMVSFDWWEATDMWCEIRGFDVLLNDVPQPVNSFGGCYQYYGNGHVDNIINVTTTPSTETLKPYVYQSPPCGNPDHGWTYLWIDNVRVRKYASPEPTTSVGAEELLQQQQIVFYIQNQTGNVGIGTTTPGSRLTVSGGSSFYYLEAPSNVTAATTTGGDFSATGTYYYVVTALDQTGLSSAKSSEVSCLIDSTSTACQISWDPVLEAAKYRVFRGTSSGEEDQYFETTSTSFIDIGTTGISGTPPSAPISAYFAGNVGIGTIAPTYKLTVDGDLYVSATSTLGSATSTPVIFGGYVQSHIIPFSDTTYNLGTPEYRWANLYVSTTTISNSLNLSYLTEGSVLFVGQNGLISQNNSNFFWDNTNLRLGIGTSTPAGILHVATGTINALVIDSSGNVGIGAVTPAGKLHVAGGNIFTEGGTVVFGTTTIPITSPIRTLICYTSTCEVPDATTTLLVGSIDDSTSSPSIIARGTISASVADIGEYVKVKGNVQDYEEGDLLEVSDENGIFQKSSKPYSEKLAGVVTKASGFIAGFSDDIQNSVILSLAGQVKVKVSTTNGEIKVGDYLTSSNIPGVAMRATEPGRVIGMALENYSGNEVGKILVFINPHWSIGSLIEEGLLTSTTTTTSEPEVRILDQFTLAIKKALEKLGLIFENGIAKIEKLFVKEITIEKAEIKEANIEKARLNKIEMVDQATNEIYCTWIENGEWKKEKGECGMLMSNVNNVILTEPSCTPNWQCTEWQPSPEEVCAGEQFIQTRTCSDLNNCGTDEEKPPESQETIGTKDCSQSTSTAPEQPPPE